MNPIMTPYLRLLLRFAPATPPPPGFAPTSPLIRGVLGKALIDRFCPYPPVGREHPPACEGSSGAADRCSLATVCPYGVLFAASTTVKRPPFALFVPARVEGREHVVEITLYGLAATRLAAWTVWALAGALDAGLGPQRVRCCLLSVARMVPGGDAVLLCGHDPATMPPQVVPDLVGLGVERFVGDGRITVELLSPTCIKDGKRPLGPRDPIPLVLLLKRIFARFEDLYGPAASELLRGETRVALDRAAAAVPLSSDETRFEHVIARSSRKDMDLSGRVGRLTYGPGAAAFLPILRAGEILHVGKNAAEGCGRMRVARVGE